MLFDAVKAKRVIPEGQEARSYADYQIEVGEMPEGVTADIIEYIPPRA